MEHYYQEPPDYDEATHDTMRSCMENLGECVFSYSDGAAWKDSWSKTLSEPPMMIKVDFKFKDEDKRRQFVVNIPVSRK